MQRSATARSYAHDLTMRLSSCSLFPAGNKIPLRAILKALCGHGGSRADQNALTDLVPGLAERSSFYLPSGRAALWLILKSLATLNPGRDNVIVPAYTCPAVVSAVLGAGLRPVLVDINLEDFGFLRQRLEQSINDRTLAVVVVHLFGFPANLNAVFQSCKPYKVYVVEDAAQGFGNSSGSSAGTDLGFQADAGFFSFGRGKPLSVLNGGLAIICREDVSGVAERIYKGLRKPGLLESMKYATILGSYLIFSGPRLYWIPQNLPFLHLGETIFEPDFMITKGLNLPTRIAGQMAGLMRQEVETRKNNAWFYYRNFEDILDVRQPPASEFPYLRYPLILEQIDRRNRLLEDLRRHGTGATGLYPAPLNELPILRDILKDHGEYPNARFLSRSLITLPVHSGVLDSHRKQIADMVRRCLDDRHIGYPHAAEAAVWS